MIPMLDEMNSGVPREVPKKDIINAKANKAPGKPPEAPLTTEQLYKAALVDPCLRRYPALWKLAAERIGEVKCQPSAMKVTAIGEGDTSRLKVKPWQINGEEAWDSVQQDIRKTKPQ